MATSDIQICSNALLSLGAQSINDFGENNDRAMLASNLWPNVRDSVLRSHNWNCCIKRVALAPDATAPDFEYAYQFTLPSDCLRVLSVGEDAEDQPAYQIEGGRILCDENPLYLRYVFRNTNAPSYDSMLADVLQQAMAAKMAYAITKSASKEQLEQRKLELLLRQARAVDGQENPPEEFGASSIMAVRGA